MDFRPKYKSLGLQKLTLSKWCKIKSQGAATLQNQPSFENWLTITSWIYVLYDFFIFCEISVLKIDMKSLLGEVTELLKIREKNH